MTGAHCGSSNSQPERHAAFPRNHARKRGSNSSQCANLKTVSDLEQLLNHEASIDRLVEELPILRLPVRLPLSMVLRVLHGLVHGTPLTGSLRIGNSST